MNKDNLYKKLLDLYRCVYSSIGVDFESVDKVDDWFLNYQIDESAEEEIVEQFLRVNRLTNLEKRILKQNYYLGVSPVVLKKEEIKL